MNDRGTVRVALVGTGSWGREQARIPSRRQDVELAAICGRTPDKTSAQAAEYGVRAYTDVRKMLDVERPEMVWLGLGMPSPVHAQAGRRALELALASTESFRSGRRAEMATASFRAAEPPPVTPPPPNP
jgi:predicted dehydrogenase